MAEGEKLLFPYEISSYNALDWSQDGTIAIATDGGVVLLTLQWSPVALDSKPIFHQSLLPCPTEVNNMTGLTAVQFQAIQGKSTTCQSQEIALNRTICPLLKNVSSTPGYKYARWSPMGGDEFGRCLLATLTHDHRLCLHSTGLVNTDLNLLADLSSEYAGKFKLTDLTFNCLKDTSYRISAAEMAWSPIFSAKDYKFSILSVGMCNGDIVLWKIKFPCKEKDDCSMITVIKLGSGIPSSMTWCKKVLVGNVACCVVGFSTGMIQAISVNVSMPNKTTTLNLCDQQDHMKVTNVSAVAETDDKITVVATKEVFILTYQVEVVYKILRLFSSSHTTGDYNYFASGLSACDDGYLLSSMDGTLLKLTKGTSFQFSIIDVKHSASNLTSWLCYGISLSHCGLLCATVFKPRSVSEDRQLRPGTLEMQIIPVDVEKRDEKLKKYLLNEQRLREIPECLEIFRENLWEGKNPLPEVNDLFSKEDKWFEFPSKSLSLLRYFLLSIQVRIPRSDKEKSEELLLSEQNISKITDILMCKHISHCLNKVIESKSKMKNNDLIVLLSMVTLMDQKLELIKQVALENTVKKIKSVLQNLNHKFECCICGTEFRLENSLYTCSQGHVFGMCCQTSLPCMYEVRSCTVCKSVATGVEEVRSLAWLDISIHHCTFCDGYLV